MRKYLLIDGNSIGHAANASSALTVGETQVQAIYTYLRVLRSLCATYSNATPVVLWDGASWRNMKFPDYKANRDKKDTTNEQQKLEAKESFKKQVPAIRKGTTLLGVAQVWAANMEADDLAAIMADRYVAQGAKVTLVTADRDWIQLIGPHVSWYDPIHPKNGKPYKVTPGNLEELFGVTTTKQFVEMKALTGDLGDNIPGVGGVGEKGAVEFLKTYGSFGDFINQALFEKTIDLKKLPKKFRELAINEDKIAIFNRNLDLMDLRTTRRPEPINLRVTKGEPDAERFRVFCERLLFRSMLRDENWFAPFSSFPEGQTWPAPMEQAA